MNNRQLLISDPFAALRIGDGVTTRTSAMELSLDLLFLATSKLPITAFWDIGRMPKF
jgi:hypothetical protein